jgi:hypothetical protein
MWIGREEMRRDTTGRGKVHLGDLEVNGIILKWILK